MRRPTDEEMNGGLTQIMMSSDQIWDPSKYTDDFDEEEQRKSYPTVPKGTEDNYDDNGEIIFKSEIIEVIQANRERQILDGEDDPYEDIELGIDTAYSTNKVENCPGSNPADSISLDFDPKPNESQGFSLEKTPETTTNISWREHRRKSYKKTADSIRRKANRDEKLRTNKHKSRQKREVYDACIDVNDQEPPQESFSIPITAPIGTEEDLLPRELWGSVLQDDNSGDIYVDSLEEIKDGDADAYYLNIGNITIDSEDPEAAFLESDQGTAQDHGERVYLDITGREIRVFVTETESYDGPLNDHFWKPYLEQDNVSRHIYQGIKAYHAQYHINDADLKEAMSPVEPRITTPTKVDHEAMRPFFAWLPPERIKQTFKYTTQFMRMPSPTYLRKRHNSPHPAANIIRRRETDCSDTIFFDVPAVDGGEEAAQLYVGRDTNFTTAHPLKDLTEESILATMQDRVNYHGAPE